MSPFTIDQPELVSSVREVGPWFHQVDLGGGIRTRDIAPADGPQPLDHPQLRWGAVKNVLPADCSGLRILDLGCADGFFSVEMARRGAAEVISVDPWVRAVERVQFLKAHFGLEAIQPKTGTVYNLSEEWGRFDFVLMLALLYHLEHPLLGLQKVASVTDCIYLETLTVDDDRQSFMYLRQPEESASHFVPKWIPTRRCLKDMLRMCKFESIEEIPTPEPGRSICIARRGRG